MDELSSILVSSSDLIGPGGPLRTRSAEFRSTVTYSDAILFGLFVIFGVPGAGKSGDGGTALVLIFRHGGG